MPAEQRALTSRCAFKEEEEKRLAMSLQTPAKIRMLQRKLYLKAKEEPTYRFYLLYDKVYREDILAHAYHQAKTNHGAPGVDGQTFEMIESGDLEKWLEGIRKELRGKTYQPQPVRRVMIPKPGGGMRPLGIPSIRDRVVQTAAKLVLEPIFEADHTIPHCQLIHSVARRIVDRDVLHLLKMWLKVPVEERDEKGNRRLTGGRKNTCGTPQGGVVSPVLANLYMNRFLKYWRMSGQKERLQAQVVNYADDFVILSRGKAGQALNWTRGVMTKLGLTLNEAKTSIKEARKESFSFLGYTFGPHHYRKDGHWYLGASPSKKSVARLRGKVGDLLKPSNVAPWPEVRDKLNSMLQGWAAYFSYGTRLMAYRAVDNYVLDRVRHFLKRRHKAPSRGAIRYSDAVVFGELGVLRLRHVHVGTLPSASK